MQNLIQSQQDFFNSNTTKSIQFRKNQLQKLYDAIKLNEETLFTAIYADFKKSEFDTFATELALIYADILDTKKNLKNWSRIKKKKTNLVNLPGKSFVIPEPLGVSLIIGAWNYPIYLALAPVVSAIAAGCTVILKPSEYPSNTSNALFKLVSENFNTNYFTVVEGGVDETSELLKHKFDKIFFTGSTAVGKIIYQAAAKHLTPVTLELGGKSPAIITADANLKMAAKRLVWAKFLNAGQTCIAPDYLLVHESIKVQFIELLKSEIKNSHFSFKNGNYVQIINKKNTERLVGLIDKTKIIVGGDYNFDDRYIAPTILNDVSFNDAIMQEEVFGPILPILSYTDLDVVIEKIKTLPKPLACYVYSSSSKIKKKILHEVSFGGGCINDSLMHISNHHLAYGGVGDSGLGAYHGEEGFKTFSHYKSILEKPTWIEPNIKYYPHTQTKLSILKKLFRIK